MADWVTAYNWMMDNEDSRRACAEVPDAPPGAFAISGVNSASFPQDYAAIAAVPQANREPLVQQFYANRFWNAWHAQMTADDVCKRVFDFAVNAGSGPAVLCLQQALNALNGAEGAQLVEDGGWGPLTLDAANAADPTALVPAFQAKRVAHYQAIVAHDPSKAQYLAAWTARAMK